MCQQDRLGSGHLLEKWNGLLSYFQELSILIPKQNFSYTLQGFCDASKGAYAALRKSLVKLSEVCSCKDQGLTNNNTKIGAALISESCYYSLFSIRTCDLTIWHYTCFTDSKVSIRGMDMQGVATLCSI